MSTKAGSELKVFVQAKLFFLYQLPPRKFWALLLDDGFNVIDFIVVSFSADIVLCSFDSGVQTCNTCLLSIVLN